MVRYLSWYMSNRKLNHKAAYKVNIKDEIEKYKKKYPDKKPLIVFDFISSMTLFVNDGKEILSTGRQTLFYKRANRFCKTLADLGVELVFFVDGPLKSFKINNWLQRVNTKYEQHQPIFEALRNGRPANLKYTGQMISGYFSNFLTIAKKYGKIFVSLHNDCDIDLAVYATNNFATAVFALDTDFLIMQGDWAIWSPHYTDLNALTTIVWNKRRLRQALHLDQNQMPILSLLSGNDFIPAEKVDYLHKSINTATNEIPEKLAYYIRINFPEGYRMKSEQFNKLARIVFKNNENGYSLDESIKIVNSTFDFYNYGKHRIPKIFPPWLQVHTEKTGFALVYQLVQNLPLVVHHSFIDLSKMDVQPYSELVLPIFRRKLGLVHYKERAKDIKRTIYLKPSHEEPFQSRVFSPIYPKKEVPSVEAILGYDKNVKVSLERKFEILLWIISPRRGKLNLTELMELEDKRFLIPMLILYYLIKETQITMEEADVVLLAIQESIIASEEKLANIIPPEIFLERPFWMAQVFTRLCRVFEDALVLCGLYDIMAEQCFDGYIFHKMYPKFMAMPREDKLKIIEPIKKYRIYCM